MNANPWEYRETIVLIKANIVQFIFSKAQIPVLLIKSKHVGIFGFRYFSMNYKLLHAIARRKEEGEKPSIRNPFSGLFFSNVCCGQGTELDFNEVFKKEDFFKTSARSTRPKLHSVKIYRPAS